MLKKFLCFIMLLAIMFATGGCGNSSKSSNSSHETPKKSDSIIASEENFNPKVFINLYNENVKKMNASDAILLRTTPAENIRDHDIYKLEGYYNSDISFYKNNNWVTLTYHVKKKSRKDLCDSLIVALETLIPGHGREAAIRLGFMDKQNSMLRFPVEVISYGNGVYTYKEKFYGCYCRVEYSVPDSFEQKPGAFSINLIKAKTLKDLE